MAPGARARLRTVNASWTIPSCSSKRNVRGRSKLQRAPARSCYAIVNRAQRRLAGAAAAELDPQQANAARHQIERIQKQLRRIDEEIQPEKKPHVEPSATHYDSGTECAASEQTRDRAGDGDLPRGRAQSSAIQLDRPTGTAASGEGRTAPAPDPG